MFYIIHNATSVLDGLVFCCCIFYFKRIAFPLHWDCLLINYEEFVLPYYQKMMKFCWINIILHLANCWCFTNALAQFVSLTKLFKIYKENSKCQTYSQHYIRTVKLALLSFHIAISKHFINHIFFFIKNEKCFVYNEDKWTHKQTLVENSGIGVALT